MIRQENDQLFWGGKNIGQCLQDVDGFYKWWPNSQLYGYLDETFLQHIWQFLKEKNALWAQQIEKELAP